MIAFVSSVCTWLLCIAYLKGLIMYVPYKAYNMHNCLLLIVRVYILTGLLIRLVDGNTYYEGRVEVNYDGEWGTVCDDGWDYRDAYVVCRQLGFGSSGLAYYNAYFGQGTGSILLDDVTCTGNEATLANCGHLRADLVRSCTHYEDAGVRCSSQGYIHLL